MYLWNVYQNTKALAVQRKQKHNEQLEAVIQNGGRKTEIQQRKKAPKKMEIAQKQKQDNE